MTMPDDNIYSYVMAACHCGLNTFRVAFRTESLPLSTPLCHCSSCRHTTGQAAAFYVPIEGRPMSTIDDGPADLDVTTYKTSDHATRHFCSVCGSHLLFEDKKEALKEKKLFVGMGLLERIEGIVDTDSHIYVEDTKDGGIADHFLARDGKTWPKYSQGTESKELPPGWNVFSKGGAEPKDDEKLSMFCHCGGISLSVTRPSAESVQCSSPFPDLILPYDVTHLSKISNPDDEKWWLRPQGANKPTKFLAGHCACTSCRLSSGFPIQSWAFIPRVNVIDTHTGNPVELEDEVNRPKGLHQYISSTGKCREFCGTCGATVFWWGLERPELVDVSVGLVDETKEGARAERWFEWHRDRVSFSELAVDKKTIQALLVRRP